MTLQEFIDQIAPLIVRYAADRGYSVPSAIIAQACLESGFGGSSLAYRYHNYFGMKCGSGWTGPSVNMRTNEEYTPGTLTGIRDNFRVYSSMEEGVAGYFDFIQYPRYANLKAAKTPEEYLQLIKADGYATSSTYVSSCLRIVEEYGLRAYDGGPVKVDPYAAVVTATSLNVRTGPGMEYPLLRTGGSDMRLPQGMVVAITEKSRDAGWGRLNDIQGWVCLDYLQA